MLLRFDPDRKNKCIEYFLRIFTTFERHVKLYINIIYIQYLRFFNYLHLLFDNESN